MLLPFVGICDKNRNWVSIKNGHRVNLRQDITRHQINIYKPDFHKLYCRHSYIIFSCLIK